MACRSSRLSTSISESVCVAFSFLVVFFVGLRDRARPRLRLVGDFLEDFPPRSRSDSDGAVIRECDLARSGRENRSANRLEDESSSEDVGGSNILEIFGLSRSLNLRFLSCRERETARFFLSFWSFPISRLKRTLKVRSKVKNLPGCTRGAEERVGEVKIRRIVPQNPDSRRKPGAALFHVLFTSRNFLKKS